jgi:hypothetical protein
MTRDEVTGAQDSGISSCGIRPNVKTQELESGSPVRPVTQIETGLLFLFLKLSFERMLGTLARFGKIAVRSFN